MGYTFLGSKNNQANQFCSFQKKVGKNHFFMFFTDTDRMEPETLMVITQQLLQHFFE